MSDTTVNKNAPQTNLVAIEALADYLMKNVSGIKTVIPEWPPTNIELEYPAISIVSEGEVTYMPLMEQTVHSRTIDDNGVARTIYNCSQIDQRLQIDLWVAYKSHRGLFFDRIMDAFNREYLDEGKPLGLNLKMSNYYDAFARYNQIGYNYVDGESSSQMREFRVMIKAEVEFPELKERREQVIRDTRIESNISEV